MVSPFEAMNQQRKAMLETAYKEGFQKGLMFGERMRTETFKMFRVALGRSIGEAEADKIMLDVASALDEQAQERARKGEIA